MVFRKSRRSSTGTQVPTAAVISLSRCPSHFCQIALARSIRLTTARARAPPNEGPGCDAGTGFSRSRPEAVGQPGPARPHACRCPMTFVPRRLGWMAREGRQAQCRAEPSRAECTPQRDGSGHRPERDGWGRCRCWRPAGRRSGPSRFRRAVRRARAAVFAPWPGQPGEASSCSTVPSCGFSRAAIRDNPVPVGGGRGQPTPSS